MEKEILNDIKLYLGSDYTPDDEPVLTMLLEKSKRKLLNKRFPFGYTDKQRAEAISQYREILFDATLYYYEKQGGEYQSRHAENGTERTYVSERTLFYDVVPLGKTIR